MFIPITRPTFDEREKELIVKPLETGWVVQGDFVRKFEENIANFTGAKYAVAVNSCTSGQFILSKIIDLGPDDEVIVPSFTWISTVNSIEFYGAKPVFCDISLDTFNIDITKIENLISKKTKAIFPVSLFGLSANMEAIAQIAEKYNLKIIEDCACSLGSRIKEKHCGLFGEAGVLSFHPRKSITTGEGGMIFTNNEEIYIKAKSLREHGAVKSDKERHVSKGSFLLTDYNEIGFNNRMTDLQGALGVAQFEKLEWILKRKQELSSIYQENLKNVKWLKLPEVPKNYYHSYQTYCCIFNPDKTEEAIKTKNLELINNLNFSRNNIMQKLEDIGISTRQGTHAVHIQNYYKEKYNIIPMEYPSSLAADKLTIALPFFPTITDSELTFLFNEINNLVI